MNKLISAFTEQLRESIEIGAKSAPKVGQKTIKNVLICGLGGSGIGATIIQNYTQYKVEVPILVCKNYNIPKFVDANTVVIICSYSGNTEETVEAYQQAMASEAMIFCISTGGKVIDIANQNSQPYVVIPGGLPPRACLAYSFVQLLFAFERFELIDSSFLLDLNASIELLDGEEENIMAAAEDLVKNIAGKTPVIYAENDMEGVAIRWRQQINENGKMLCWHHIIPEMNHNELVGWREGNMDKAVIFLRNTTDYVKSQQRIEINKIAIAKETESIHEVWSRGESYLERALYLIHFGDWVSWYLSVANGADAMEVNVIDHLKGELAK